MYIDKPIKIFEDDWQWSWSILNVTIWRYWKRHAQGETGDPNVLLMFNGSRQIYLIRIIDIDTEMASYTFQLVDGKIEIISGNILLHSLIDGGTRINISTLPLDVDKLAIDIEQRKTLEDLSIHQKDFLLKSFNAFIKWLPTQSSKEISADRLFLKSVHAILQVIHNIGKQFERLPSTYRDKKEEELRDHFLLTLEPLFQGSATGETFNKSGKTDILLRSNKENIFIAECKFWRGEKNF